MRRYDESELEAYVDGELDAVRCAELAAWLSRNPEAQALAETLRYQNAGLHAVFDSLLGAPVPSRLLARLGGPRRKRRLGHIPLMWLVTGGLLLVASALMGWLAHGYSLSGQALGEKREAQLRLLEQAGFFCNLPDDFNLEPGPFLLLPGEAVTIEGLAAEGLATSEEAALTGPSAAHLLKTEEEKPPFWPQEPLSCVFAAPI